jgi:uncharacterized protein (TIGR02996 family)
MHPEADAFLDAIFDHPDDDTPRLVYADWLQEHGQESYAQFIRLQCAAAREKPWSDPANRLWEEIGRVWNRLDEEWWPATREMLPRVDELLDAVHFDRGFLRADITVTPEYLQYACCWPWLPAPGSPLVLEWPVDDFDGTASSPLLRRIRHVKGRLYAGDWNDLGRRACESIVTVLRSPHLCRARVLDLTGFPLNQAVVRALLNAPNLATVEEVSVRYFERRECDPVEVVLQLKSRFKRVVRH